MRALHGMVFGERVGTTMKEAGRYIYDWQGKWPIIHTEEAVYHNFCTACWGKSPNPFSSWHVIILYIIIEIDDDEILSKCYSVLVLLAERTLVVYKSVILVFLCNWLYLNAVVVYIFGMLCLRFFSNIFSFVYLPLFFCKSNLPFKVKIEWEPWSMRTSNLD